uniref:Uncharacterized protein n=1 Tax=Arundo donax TaxID=35708 RepID=A0A0A8ZMW4_ARUDO
MLFLKITITKELYWLDHSPSYGKYHSS